MWLKETFIIKNFSCVHSNKPKFGDFPTRDNIFWEEFRRHFLVSIDVDAAQKKNFLVKRSNAARNADDRRRQLSTESGGKLPPTPTSTTTIDALE